MNPGPATIRLQRETDACEEAVARLRELLIASPTYSRLTIGHVSDGSTAGDVFSARPPDTQHDQKYVFSIMLDHQMIGCIDAIRGWPDAATCHVGLLLIDERQQRRGYGREAMRLLREEIEQWSGIIKLRIGVVANNAPAFPFWRAMGFTETGERKQNPAFTSDIVIMTSPLLREVPLSGVASHAAT